MNQIAKAALPIFIKEEYFSNFFCSCEQETFFQFLFKQDKRSFFITVITRRRSPAHVKGKSFFGFCSRTRFYHLSNTNQHRWGKKPLEGYLLSPGFLPWRLQCCRKAQPSRWWSFRKRFSRKFAFCYVIWLIESAFKF